MSFYKLFGNEFAFECRARTEPLVRDFAIQHLAGILFRCVECKVTPRKETDWITAKAIVLSHSHHFSYLSSRLLALKAYEIERIEKQHLAPISRNVIQCFDGERSELARIEGYLLGLGSDRLNYLLARAADECQWDQNFTELVLGRRIFSLHQETRGELPRDCYGRILFY